MPRYMDAYWVYCFYRDFSVRNPLKIPMETKAWAKGSPELVEFGVRVGELGSPWWKYRGRNETQKGSRKFLGIASIVLKKE